MGKIIKIFTILTAVFLTFNSTVTAAQNEKYADILFKAGLFKGTDNGYELDSTLTREQAATMLVRLLGEEENIKNENYSPRFSDVAEERWSYQYVMYCYENEITRGTSDNTFSPDKQISAEEFITLVLRLLGYTECEPETAYEEAVVNGLINSEAAKQMYSKKQFTRDDMVYVAYRSLKTKTSDGVLLARKLEEQGVLEKSLTDELDVYSQEVDIETLIESIFE